MKDWREQSTPKKIAKEYHWVTCRIGGCERRVLSGVERKVVPAAQYWVCVRERGLQTVCVVGPIDIVDGTQQWLTCRFESAII